MAISSYKSCARRAKLIKENTTFWIGVGKFTEWDNENSPPNETRLDELTEPICFVKASNVNLCKPVLADGDITYRGQSYSFVEDEDAVDELARFIYMIAEFHPSQGMPYGTYRQRAVLSELVPAVGHENDAWLAPANVLDQGITELLENDTPCYQSLEKYQVIPVVLEIR
jgi:hypothetical protein